MFICVFFTVTDFNISNMLVYFHLKSRSKEMCNDNNNNNNNNKASIVLVKS